MASTYDRVSRHDTQCPPIVRELEAIFNELPDETLLSTLRGNPRRRGPKGYEARILWHCYIAYYYLGLPSVSDLIRCLHDNPFIARACGIGSPDDIPSQPTFSRFGSKLAQSKLALLVKTILRTLTRKLYETLPGFGKSVAIDSTDIKGWSNAGKKGKPHKQGKIRQKPRVGKVSDPDAGWCVKTNTEGNRKYVWGYKVHILADTTYELPVAVAVSAGNVHDSQKASALLSEARFTNSKFHPEYVICDSAYSGDSFRTLVKRQYRAEPIIDPNPSHKRAFAKTEKTPEWKAIYNRRTAIERLNGRLKGHRKLNFVRVRGRFKVGLHTMLSVIVCQAQALATGCRASVRKVA